MTRSEYYDQMRALARDMRSKHNLTTARVLRTDMRRIYREERISIDFYPLGSKVRGAYFNDDCGVQVVLAKGLPPEPTIFTMAHELKHHLVDSGSVLSFCKNTPDESNAIEIAAEVFAGELIFPDAQFIEEMDASRIARGRCTAEDLVRFKDRTRTTLSYAALLKRAEWLGFAARGAIKRVAWRKLEEQVLGIRDFRRPRRRASGRR